MIRRSVIALGAALAVLVVVLLLANGGGVSTTPETALASHPTPDNCLGCKMSLEVEGTFGVSPVTCDSKTGTVQNPAKCTLGEGSSLVVKIVANTIPPGGYAGWQTFITYGGLGYKPTALAEDENVWPDGIIPVRSNGEVCPPSCGVDGDEGRVVHGNLSGLVPPIPLSSHVGPIIELQMNCQAGALLVLLPRVPTFPDSPWFIGAEGTTYVNASIPIEVKSEGTLNLDIDNDGQLENPGDLLDYPVHAVIDVNCAVAPTPPPATPVPVGGVGLQVDIDALRLDSSHSSSGPGLLPAAALATLAFIVFASGAWYARSRRGRPRANGDVS